jgi:hypothetical protein
MAIKGVWVDFSKCGLPTKNAKEEALSAQVRKILEQIDEVQRLLMERVKELDKHPAVLGETNLSLRTLMDKRRVLLVNLSKGKLEEDASHLLGGLLMTRVGLAAFSRADQPEPARIPHQLYADEFQNFTTLSLVNISVLPSWATQAP